MPDVRWLDREQERTWRSFVRVIRLLSAALERDLQREGHLPLTYYEILMALSEASEQALRMSDLAQILQVSPSRLSHAIDRMEASGWVRRQPCPSDRRVWITVLTDEGFSTLKTAAPFHVESVQRRLFDPLTGMQERQLGEISETLLRHLSTTTGETPGATSPASQPGADLESNPEACNGTEQIAR